MTFLLASAFGWACLTSTLLTRGVGYVAPAIGLVDEPNARKHHRCTTPLGGGLAIGLAVLLVLSGAGELSGARLGQSRPAWGLLLATLWITAIGVADDLWELRARYKMLGQLIAAAILVRSGLGIEQVTLCGYSYALGHAAVPLTIFWLVGATNAFNLMDGMDGWASSLALLMALALAILALLTRQLPLALLAVALAGALCGFLVHNLPPARIFLGDSGSLLLGLLLGAMTLLAVRDCRGTIAALAPIALWSIPIVDCMIVIVRRVLAGRHFYLPDRGHLHHRLLDLLMSSRKALLVVTCLGLFTMTMAVLSFAWKAAWLAVAAVLITTLTLGICHSVTCQQLESLLAFLGGRRRRVPFSGVVRRPLQIIAMPSTYRSDLVWSMAASVYRARSGELLVPSEEHVWLPRSLASQGTV